MGFLDKFKKKKNPLYDNNTPKYDGYEEDLSDDGSAGLDVYNDPAEPRDFNMESSTVEKPKISEYESSLNEFERLNNDQLDPQSKTSMKHKKEKTLYSTIVKAFRKARYNANNSAKNGADVAKSFDIKNSTKTSEEDRYRGLKKNYIYIAVGIFFTIVCMSLLFANNGNSGAGDNASQDVKAASNGADIRTTNNKPTDLRNNGAISDLPSNYSDAAKYSRDNAAALDTSKLEQKDKTGDLKADAKSDERGKTNAAGSSQSSTAAAKGTQGVASRSTSGSSNVTPPPMPGAPPMPGSSTSASAGVPTARREVSQQEQAEIRAKEQATTSAISFGISNGGVK